MPGGDSDSTKPRQAHKWETVRGRYILYRHRPERYRVTEKSAFGRRLMLNELTAEERDDLLAMHIDVLVIREFEEYVEERLDFEWLVKNKHNTCKP